METAIASHFPPKSTPSSSFIRGSPIAWTTTDAPPVAHLDEDDDACALRAQLAAHKQFVDDVELGAVDA